MAEQVRESTRARASQLTPIALQSLHPDGMSEVSKPYFPALTGLRAVAAVLVLAHHFNPLRPARVGWRLPVTARVLPELTGTPSQLREFCRPRGIDVVELRPGDPTTI